VLRTTGSPHLGGESRGERLELADRALVEREEEVAEPHVLGCSGKLAEDGVDEELAEVVDAVAEERGEREVVRAHTTLVCRQVRQRHAREVEERMPVVRPVLGARLVQVRAHAVVRRVDARLDRAQPVERALSVVEVRARAVGVAKEQSGTGTGCDEEDVRRRGGGFRQAGRERGQERYQPLRVCAWARLSATRSGRGKCALTVNLLARNHGELDEPERVHTALKVEHKVLEHINAVRRAAGLVREGEQLVRQLVP
jgi:hypothetical protein